MEIRKSIGEFLIIGVISIAVAIWSNPPGDAHRKKIAEHLKERDLASRVLSGIVSETAIYKKIGLLPSGDFAIASFTEDPRNGRVVSYGMLGLVFLNID